MDLRFDTGFGRDTAGKLGQCAGDLESELSAASSSVDALVGGAWVAPAANQFQDEFNDWAGQVRSTIEALRTLQNRLNSEIEQWEATAQSV